MLVILQAAPARLSRRSSVVVRADGFLGSPNNLVSVAGALPLLRLRLVDICAGVKA